MVHLGLSKPNALFGGAGVRITEASARLAGWTKPLRGGNVSTDRDPQCSLIGTGAAQSSLIPMVEACAPYRNDQTLITADAGYFSKNNLVALDVQNFDALIADTQMRERDERFEGQARRKAKPDPFYDKSGAPKRAPCCVSANFSYDQSAGTCVCPANKSLYRHGSNCNINGRDAI